MAKVVPPESLEAALADGAEAYALLDALYLMVEPGLQRDLCDAIQARVDALTTFMVDGGVPAPD
jgi:hypothetical protein